MFRFSCLTVVFFAVFSCNSKKPDLPPAEQWVVMEKNRYSYRLNEFGQPDTVFIASIKYKDGAVTDSTVNYVVNRWKDNRVTDEMRFVLDKNNVSGLLTVARYEYDSKKRLVSKRTEASGKLLTTTTYDYNPAGRLIKQTTVQVAGSSSTGGTSLDISKTESANIIYDTTSIAFQYDSVGKIMEARYMNNRNEVYARDVNTYSGNDPLLVANINAKGDTLKKVTFERRDKVLMTVTETDSFTLFQNLVNGIQVAQKTKYKNRNEQWRSAVRFNEATGRKEEEILYKLL